MLGVTQTFVPFKTRDWVHDRKTRNAGLDPMNFGQQTGDAMGGSSESVIA
jgi:hypothetical protein